MPRTRFYDDVIPTPFTLTKYDVRPSGLLGPDTGRILWLVVCRKCRRIVAPHTTDPNAWKCWHCTGERHA